MSIALDWLLAALSTLRRDEAFAAAQSAATLPLTRLATPPEARDTAITIYEAAVAPRITIIGPAGAGKTTLLRQYAADTAHASLTALRRGQARDHVPPAPIYIDLGQFRGTIEATLAAQQGGDAPPLRDLAESCDLLFLLDGLDRIPPQAQLAGLGAIQRTLQGLGDRARWIATCRDEVVDLFRPWLSDAPVFQIGMLPAAQVVEEIERQGATQTIGWLAEQSDLIELARRPRWLKALTTLRGLGRGPASRGPLLRSLVGAVLSETAQSATAASEALEALPEIAALLDRTGRDSASLSDAALALSLPGDRAAALRLLISAGVLSETIHTQTIQFAQPVLRSLARALGLARRAPSDWGEEVLGRGWRDALTLAYGMHPGREQVLAWLLRHDAADLVARCLADTATPDQFEGLLQQHTTITPPMRIRLADAFQSLGLATAAVAQLERAGADGYDETGLFRRLGDLYARAAQWRSARLAYTQALAREPDDLRYRFRLGIACGRLGELIESEAALQGALGALRRMQGEASAELGEVYMTQGRLELALAAYQQAVSAQPGTSSYHRGMAAILHRLGRSAAAEEILRDLVAVRHDDAEALADLGRIYAETGRSESAIASLMRAAALRPNDPTTYATLGRLRLAGGDTAGARAALLRACQIAPDDASMQIAYSEACAAAGDRDGALAAARRATQIEPRSLRALRQLGALLSDAQAFDEATSVLRGALAIQPDDAETLAGLGHVLRRRGDGEQALGLFRQALQHAPGNPDYELALGLTLQDLGRTAEAANHLARAISYAPGRADLQAAIAEHHEAREEWQEAAAGYQRAAELAPGRADYCRLAALSQLRNGDMTAARALLAAALRRGRRDQATWLTIGRLHAEAGRLRRGVRALRRAGTSGEALALLGQTLHALGHVEESVAAFGQAVLTGSPGSETLEHYSRALADSGQLSRAYDIVRRALAGGAGRPSTLVLAGTLARRLGRPHEALTLLNQALALTPDLAIAHAERGLVLLGMDQPQPALDAVRVALSGDPQLATAALTAGLALARLGRREEARAYIDQAVASAPNNPEIHAAQRDLLSQLDPAIALAAARRAADLAPDDPAHALRLGELLLAQGDIPAATQAFESALGIDRRQHAAHVWLSRVYARAGDWQLARRYAEQAITLAPEIADHQSLLAEALAGGGDLPGAVQLLTDAIANLGERVEWLHALGMVLVRAGETARGLAYLRRATQADPQRAVGHRDLALALAASGDMTHAVVSLTRAIQLRPEDAEWRGDLAQLQLQRGWYAEALAEVDAARQLAPTSLRLQQLRAAALARLGRNDEAHAELLAALRSDPDNLPALRLFTEVALKRAQPKTALGAARRAVALQPDDPALRRQMAEALRALGRPGEAAEQLERTATTIGLADDYAALAEDYQQAQRSDRARWAWEQAISADPEQAALRVRYGAFLLREGDLEGARAEIGRAAALQPDMPLVGVHMAELLLFSAFPAADPHSPDLAQAAQAARRAAALDPQSGPAWRALGAALWRMGDHEEAIAALRRARGLAGDDAVTAGVLGVVALALGEADEAQAAFDAATQLAPRSASTHAGLAIALRSPLGAPSEPEELEARARSAADALSQGLQAIDQALAIEPGRPRWRYERAMLLQLAGRHAESLADFQRALEQAAGPQAAVRSWEDLIDRELGQAPAEPLILQRAALAHELLGQLDEAATILDRLLAEHPDLPLAVELRGLIAARRGELSLARDLLGAVIELAPAARRALAAFGQVLLALGKPTEALAPLERASDQKPSDAGLVGMLADAYIAAGKRDRAIQSAAKAARLEPQEATHHHRLARLYSETGRLQEARAELMSAITLRPNVPAWHAEMAQICSGLGMQSAARGALRKAAELTPDDPAYSYELARYLADQGDPEEARATLEQVVAKAPERGDWRHELGRLYQHLGDPAAALGQFAAAVQYTPDEPRHWVALAEAQRPAIGEEMARETIERGLERFPDDPGLHTAAGALFEDFAPDTALWHYQRAIEAEPTVAEPWWRYSRALVKGGDRQMALKAIERALAIDPRSAAAHAVKAQLLAGGGDLQGALHHGRAAASLGPTDPATLASIAGALQKARRYDEALQVLLKASDRRPDDPELIAECGDAAMAASRSAQAIDLYERAIQLRPSDASLYFRAGVAYKQGKNYSTAIRMLRRAIQLRPSYGDAIQELSKLGPLAFASHYMGGGRPASPPDDAPRVDDLPPFERPDRRS